MNLVLILAVVSVAAVVIFVARTVRRESAYNRRAARDFRAAYLPVPNTASSKEDSR